MKQRDDVELVLAAWFDATAPDREPEYLIDAVLSRAGRTGRRPAWRIPERWIPMQTSLRFQRMPSLVPLLILLALAIAAVTAALFVGSRSPRLPAPFGPATNGRVAYISESQVWTAAEDGSGARALTSDPTAKGIPIWSRDGTRLAYVAYMNASSREFPDLVVVAQDGSNKVTIDQRVEMLGYPSWSPNGRTIAYSKWITYPGQRDRVFIAAADGSAPPRQIGDPQLSAFHPTFSPDGQRIAFISDHNDGFALHVMNADGTKVRELTPSVEPAADLERGARGFEWSPDGTQILYTGKQTTAGSWRGLYVVPSDGSGAEVLVTDDPGTGPAHCYSGSWSPSGDRIVYLRGDSGGLQEAVVARFDNANPTVVARNVAAFAPQWSPDGRSIALIDPVSPTGGAIRVVSADGQGPPVLIRTSGATADIETSPGVDPVAWQRLAR
jgi:Tol biopolymer transport system component